MLDSVKIIYERETGEVLSEIHRTAEQDIGWAKRRARETVWEARKSYYRQQVSELGHFVWFLYNINEALRFGLSPANLTRVIYLATYMNYDNYLVYNNGTKIKSTSVGEILGVGRRMTDQFFNEVLGLGIITKESKTKFLKLNEDIFARGSLREIEIDKSAIRLYIDGVRNLYEGSLPKEHKTLSYVFQAIPYVNFDYNILCLNQREQDIKAVKALSVSGYCGLVEYNTANVRRFKTLLKNIRVGDEGVFGFVDTADSSYIIINPRIFYAGSQHDQVMILGKFFKERGDSISK